MAINHSKQDASRALYASLIDQARQSLTGSLDFKSSWLIDGGIGSHQWKVLCDDKKVETINFAQPLANLTSLTDPENIFLLECIQKQSFNLRQGYLNKRLNYAVWLKHVHAYFNIASWLVLNNDQYRPQTMGFKLLDENACRVLCDDYSNGGWASVLQFKDRLCDHFCALIGEPYEGGMLSGRQIGKIIVYLKMHRLYISNDSSKPNSEGLVSRVYLANALGTHPSAFLHMSIRSFLRQFEISLQGPILTEAKTRKAKYNSHRTPTAYEPDHEKVAQKSLKQFLICLKSLSAGHDLLPDSMPSFVLNVNGQLNKSDSKANGHTRKIPYSIGMHALDKSIEWVMVYGSAIVDATVELVSGFNNEEFIQRVTERYMTEEKQRLFENVISEYNTAGFEDLTSAALTEALGIKKLIGRSYKDSSFGNMSFMVALECLIASCALVIGFTKPIRIEELSQITRDSLSYQTDGGGAFLTHPVLKTHLPIPPNIRLPIPYVASRAIQLLGSLGSRLKLIYGDTTPHSNDLFYFPSAKGFRRPTGKTTSVRIDAAIRLFCDIIEIPVDNQGRRWYIKVHEMRKFFILSMHSHEHISSDDALRMQAGHSKKEYLFDYLSGDVPEEEVMKYGIECIEDKLIKFELGFVSGREAKGVAALYKHTLTSLRISSLKSKNSYEFHQFLRTLLVNKQLLISVYTIRLTTYSNEIIDTEFALKYGEAQDENFNN
ncbi:hypothetical protein [Pseudomonas syringae]|uniref:hypothetical protein n=1 Tax=Pseudomonas syringae TaxID=317 RepID=UPI001F0D3E59|nr:hypothetical protein [Pseudomonas syringae]MCH5518692.1 hypothetical protein [Pseudomonas syringae pv. lapsa]